MPRKAKELSDVEVRRLAKKAGFHAVGGVRGLYLQCKRPPAASWILYTKLGNDRPKFGLGPYPEIGLGEARERARRYREQIEQGIDPRESKRAARAALIASRAKVATFEDAARRCHKAKSAEFRNAKHQTDWITSLEMHAFPLIGDVQVSDVEQAHAVNVLEPIWTSKTETATRVRQRCETVLEWARVSGLRNGENPFRWKGNLEHVLPRPSKVRKVRHHPALPWQLIPAFMGELRQRGGVGARALEFIVLTAARSGELRFATWDEIDLDAKLWTIPGDRMKAGKAHTVPLSDPAVKLLNALPRFEGSNYVFPAVRGGALSDMTISAVCRRMHADAVEAGGAGWKDPTVNRTVVPHGFRSSFRDWCAESTNYPREVAEQALAHAIESKVEAAYRRGELLAKRTKLMTAWAKFVSSTPAAKAGVTAIGGRRG